MQWMKEDASVEQTILNTQEIWNASDFLKTDERPNSLDLKAELNKSMKRIRKIHDWSAVSADPDEQSKDERRSILSTGHKINPWLTSNKNDLLPYVMRLAAIILVAFMSGIFITHLFYVDNTQEVNSEPAIRDISTRAGQMANASLKDGSRLNLSAMSKVVISEAFYDNHWELFMEGLVHFDVVPDQHKSFLIRTPETDIRVFGTEFSVRAYPDDDYVQIIVASGKVSMETGSGLGKQLIILEEGEMGLLNKKEGELSKNVVDARKHMGWLEGRLVFEDVTLAEASRDLQRWFDVQILIEDELLAEKRITAVVNNRSLTDVLNVMGIIMDAAYTIDETREVVEIRPL